MTMELCPCCSGLAYKACCGPYHQGTPAPTAIALMRSRYSAYARGLFDYIIRTTHPKNPRYEKNLKKWAEEILHFSHETEFTKLEIVGFGEDWVEFTAHMKQGGSPILLKEKSQFAKIDGKWLYLSGILTETKSKQSKS